MHFPKEDLHRSFIHLLKCFEICKKKGAIKEKPLPLLNRDERIFSFGYWYYSTAKIKSQQLGYIKTLKTTPAGVVCEKSTLKAKDSSLSTRKKLLLPVFIKGVGKYIIIQEKLNVKCKL